MSREPTNENAIKVRFADECIPCPDCGEPYCPECDVHYSDCQCPGPTQDDEYNYTEIDGVLYATPRDAG